MKNTITSEKWEYLCKDISHPNIKVALIEYDQLDEYFKRLILEIEKQDRKLLRLR